MLANVYAQWFAGFQNSEVFKSENYIKLLSEMIVPIIKLNYGNTFWYQDDNSKVHSSKKAKKYIQDSNMKLVPWPSRSPDLNIVEHI